LLLKQSKGIEFIMLDVKTPAHADDSIWTNKNLEMVIKFF